MGIWLNDHVVAPARLVWQAAGRATGPTGPARGMTLAGPAGMYDIITVDSSCSEAIMPLNLAARITDVWKFRWVEEVCDSLARWIARYA